jgi:hypothetical protein
MTRFERNPAFLTELQNEREFVAHMRASTTQVAAAIREQAPKQTGYYRRHVVPRGTQVRLEDPFWHLVEYGSRNNPAYSPARRGVIAAGLRLDPSRI